MAYSGFLIKVGDYTIPAGKYIKSESYKAYASMQDVNPYEDANGYVHRNAVELKAVKVEFETPSMLTNADFKTLMENIQANYTVPKARQLVMTVYVPEYDKYVTQTAYLADFQPQIYSSIGNVIKYNPIRLAFIGGIYDG